MSTRHKYSYQWSANVVNRFVEKYARGSNYLADLLSITNGELRHQLIMTLSSGNSLKWESLKRLIIHNEGNLTNENKAYSPEIKRELYKRLVSMSIDEQLDDIPPNFGLDRSHFQT